MSCLVVPVGMSHSIRCIRVDPSGLNKLQWQQFTYLILLPPTSSSYFFLSFFLSLLNGSADQATSLLDFCIFQIDNSPTDTSTTAPTTCLPPPLHHHHHLSLVSMVTGGMTKLITNVWCHSRVPNPSSLPSTTTTAATTIALFCCVMPAMSCHGNLIRTIVLKYLFLHNWSMNVFVCVCG